MRGSLCCGCNRTHRAKGRPGALQSPQQDKRMGFQRPSVIDANRLGLTGAPKDPKAVLAVVGWRGPVDRTIVAGKSVMKNGHLLGIDEERVAAEADSAKRAVKKINSAIERTTLGDISELAALKDKLEKGE